MLRFRLFPPFLPSQASLAGDLFCGGCVGFWI